MNRAPSEAVVIECLQRVAAGDRCGFDRHGGRDPARTRPRLDGFPQLRRGAARADGHRRSRVRIWSTAVRLGVRRVPVAPLSGLNGESGHDLGACAGPSALPVRDRREHDEFVPTVQRGAFNEHDRTEDRGEARLILDQDNERVPDPRIEDDSLEIDSDDELGDAILEEAADAEQQHFTAQAETPIERS